MTQNYATTITNDANFTIFPELISMGYSKSLTAGMSIGWSKTNNSSSVKQLSIITISDMIRASRYSKISDYYCTVDLDQTYTITKGWMFDLR